MRWPFLAYYFLRAVLTQLFIACTLAAPDLFAVSLAQVAGTPPFLKRNGTRWRGTEPLGKLRVFRENSLLLQGTLG